MELGLRALNGYFTLHRFQELSPQRQIRDISRKLKALFINIYHFCIGLQNDTDLGAPLIP